MRKDEQEGDKQVQEQQSRQYPLQHRGDVVVPLRLLDAKRVRLSFVLGNRDLCLSRLRFRLAVVWTPVGLLLVVQDRWAQSVPETAPCPRAANSWLMR